MNDYKEKHLIGGKYVYYAPQKITPKILDEVDARVERVRFFRGLGHVSA